jgi:predicted TIM-barrel fold metal-dependent hydrolase
MEVVDAHVHFISHNYLRLLTQQRNSYQDVDIFISERAKKHHFEPPPLDPVRLADRWVIEMDRHGVSRAAVISMIPGDEVSVSSALRIYPERFFGVATVNPYLTVAEELVEHAALEWGFRGIMLYPSLFKFSMASERLYPIYRIARKHRMAVYAHMGRLRMAARRWWGLPDVYDWRYADPSDLHQPAADFPSVPFVVLSFGCGCLPQLLKIGLQCPNVHVDTSSSNNWLLDQSEFTDLAHAYERTLEVFGPGRILFGSDSDFFPRGWRKPILDEQAEILKSMGLSEHARAAIFSENAKTIFNLDQ